MPKNRTRSALTALAGLALVVSIAPAARATTTPTHWNLASNGIDAAGRSFAGGGVLSFSGTYNANGYSVTCAITGGFSYVASDPPPHAAPGGAITVAIDPPDDLAPGHGTCAESITGGAVEIASAPGSLWTMTVTTPTGTGPSPSNGPFTGTLTIPAGSMTTTLPWGGQGPGGKCVIRWPASPLTMSATYDGATGEAKKYGTPIIDFDRSQCSAAGRQGALARATAVLSEVGAPSNHPNLIYVP